MNVRTHLPMIDLEHHVLERRRAVVDADLPDADVVVASWWETAEWVSRLSRRKGAKAYFIQHHEAFPGQPIERVKATWRLPMHKKLRFQKWLVDLAAHDYGDRDVSHVPNSVDTEQFFADPRGKQDIATIGFLYSRVPWKGIDASLAALELVQRQIPRVRLLAFGAESPPKNCPLPIGTEFFLQPPQNNIHNIYSKCDAWLCTSRSEGFHLPPLEAMACRCRCWVDGRREHFGLMRKKNPASFSPGSISIILRFNTRPVRQAILSIVCKSKSIRAKLSWTTTPPTVISRAC